MSTKNCTALRSREKRSWGCVGHIRKIPYSDLAAVFWCMSCGRHEVLTCMGVASSGIIGGGTPGARSRRGTIPLPARLELDPGLSGRRCSRVPTSDSVRCSWRHWGPPGACDLESPHREGGAHVHVSSFVSAARRVTSDSSASLGVCSLGTLRRERRDS